MTVQATRSRLYSPQKIADDDDVLSPREISKKAEIQRQKQICLAKVTRGFIIASAVLGGIQNPETHCSKKQFYRNCSGLRRKLHEYDNKVLNADSYEKIDKTKSEVIDEIHRLPASGKLKTQLFQTLENSFISIVDDIISPPDSPFLREETRNGQNGFLMDLWASHSIWYTGSDL
ncbi:MAG TPA: hypothetical protein VLE96_02980 [Chlamydiales bacterium]|nr:hypothetical protein [Chlamydiales bacterium]